MSHYIMLIPLGYVQKPSCNASIIIIVTIVFTEHDITILLGVTLILYYRRICLTSNRNSPYLSCPGE